jgi:hypothetical protein
MARAHLPPPAWHDQIRGREAHGRRWWRAPSPLYAASFSNPKATTQSRRWEVSVLTTYCGGDGPRTAGDGKAARPVLEDDGGSFRCSSGSGDGPDDGGVEGGPPSSGRLTSEALIRRGDSASSGGYGS